MTNEGADHVVVVVVYVASMWPLTESLTLKPSVAHEIPSFGAGGGAMVSREMCTSGNEEGSMSASCLVMLGFEIDDKQVGSDEDVVVRSAAKKVQSCSSGSGTRSSVLAFSPRNRNQCRFRK